MAWSPHRRPTARPKATAPRTTAVHEMLIGEGFHDREFGVSGGEMLGTPEPAEPAPAPVSFTIKPPRWHGMEADLAHSTPAPPLTMLLDCTATR